MKPEGIDWESANDAAVAAGGYLATITSAEENAFVYSLASSNTEFWTPGRAGTNIGPWLGGFQPDGSPEPGGNWQWVTGELFIYTYWAYLEPNNHFHGGYEDRLHFLGKSGLMDSTWNDLYAYDDIPPHSYVVEVPEPSTLLLLGLGGIFLRKRKQ